MVWLTRRQKKHNIRVCLPRFQVSDYQQNQCAKGVSALTKEQAKDWLRVDQKARQALTVMVGMLQIPSCGKPATGRLG